MHRGIAQSIAFDVEGGELMPNTWYDISIPLENLNAEKKTINFVSIVSTIATSIHLSTIEFNKAKSVHAKWIAPPDSIYSNESLEATLVALLSKAKQITLVDSEGLPKPYQSDFSTTSPWLAVNGKFSVADGLGIFSSLPSENAVLSVLGGGNGWSDYRSEILVGTWGKGEAIALIARFKNTKNYATCSFSNYGSYVGIGAVINGVFQNYGGSPDLPISDYKPWENVSLAIEARGDEIRCFVGKDEILRYKMTGLPFSGGVGIEVWDRARANATQAINSVTVTAL